MTKLTALIFLKVFSLVAITIVGSIQAEEIDPQEKIALIKQQVFERLERTTIELPPATVQSKTKNEFDFSSEIIPANNSAAGVPTSICDPLLPFWFFGVEDQGLNDSQLFVWNANAPNTITPIGPVHVNYDIESLDSATFDGGTSACIWATSGDDDDKQHPPAPPCTTGCLYAVNKATGEILNSGVFGGDICDASTGEDLIEVDAAAFFPRENPRALTGWSQHQGLFFISSPPPVPNLCEGNRAGVPASMLCTYYDDDFPEESQNKLNDLVVEDMTWSNDIQLLYLAIDNTIWKMNLGSCEAEFICMAPTEIEALEILPPPQSGLLVIGYHFPTGNPNNAAVAAIDPTQPRTNPDGTINSINCGFVNNVKLGLKADVEGLANP